MIKLDNLCKNYKKLKVLNNITTTISQGEVTIVVGPNGSGKSTLIKCILGLVKPTSGTITVNNILVNDNYTYRKEIGYIPQFGHFPNNLNVLDVIRLIREIRSNFTLTNHHQLPFDLKSEYNKKINTLSGGTKQKLSSNLAFLFDSNIYICDEPTAGLDPVANQYFKSYIEDLKKKNKTIIIASHVISEVEDIADNIIFICEGKLKYSGSIKLLKDQTNEEKLEKAVVKLMDSNL